MPEEGWDGNKEAKLWEAVGCQRQLDLIYNTASGGHPQIKYWAQLHTHTKLQLVSVSFIPGCSFLVLLLFWCVYGGVGGFERLRRREGHGWWERQALASLLNSAPLTISGFFFAQCVCRGQNLVLSYLKALKCWQAPAELEFLSTIS